MCIRGENEQFIFELRKAIIAGLLFFYASFFSFWKILNIDQDQRYQYNTLCEYYILNLVASNRKFEKIKIKVSGFGYIIVYGWQVRTLQEKIGIHYDIFSSTAGIRVDRFSGFMRSCLILHWYSERELHPR